MRPSTKLHTLDAAEQTRVAKHRQSEPHKLAHLISGDLDWVVMKCLEKDRTRRYETVNGLAADLQRRRIRVVARSGNFFADRECKSAAEVKKISAALLMAEIGMAEGMQVLRRAKIGKDRQLIYHDEFLFEPLIAALEDARVTPTPAPLN